MKRKHELPDVNGATVVGVKYPEHVLAELLGITIWKESAVNLNKLTLVNFSRWKVFPETFVPVLKSIKTPPRFCYKN